MAIKSKIKSIAKKAVSKVKSFLSGTNASKQLASVGSLLSKPIDNKGALDYTGSRQRVDQATGGYTGYGASGSWEAPKTTTGGFKITQPTKNYLGANPQGGSGQNAYGPLPVTISSGKAGSPNYSPQSSTNLFSTTDFSGATNTISSNSQAALGGGSSPITLASAPTSVNPGAPNTTGLAGSMAGYYTRKEDGTFEPVTQDPFGEKSDDEIIKDKAKLYKEVFGDPESVYEDREVRQAQEARRQAQEALQAPTAELNAIIAQQNKDLLSLRQTAQKEGVVEAVYGAQSNAINYNAAIRALPLQAHISALQGNLELAQDYLTELVSIKKEQIKTQYDYNKGLFDTIYSALDAKEKRVADRLIKENDRQYKAEDELIDYKAQLVQQALSVGASAVTINAIERAKDKVSAAKAAGNLTPPKPVATTGGGVLNQLPTSIQNRVVKKADDVANDPRVKKFLATADSINQINSIDPKSKNPADHQQIVYAFAKALDPDSAVKEGEYETIRKYAQSTLDRYKKEFDRVFAGNGFLSEKAIMDIQKTMNNSYASRKPLYDGAVSEATRVINNIAGADVAGEIMTDFTTGVNTPSSAKSPTPTVTTKSGKPFDVQAALNSGYSQAEIENYLKTH